MVMKPWLKHSESWISVGTQGRVIYSEVISFNPHDNSFTSGEEETKP